MMTETNIIQFKSWLSSASPDDIANVAPVLINRIGNLDQAHKQRFIQEI